MPYPKKFMSISELCKVGMSRSKLKQYVHMPKFPAKKLSPSKNSKYLVDTDPLDEWLKRYGGRV